MGTELVSIPANIELPAHLRTPEAAAEIAAANAAAAGGIKVGGFPSISIKANRFHIKENGELNTLNQAPINGQPALPLMCLEIVVLDANPAINKTYYAGDFVEGADPKEPECRSSNGVTPDADVSQRQNDVCATCKQNQWGSKVSKFSQKDIKACDDSKQLAVVPAADLKFKALGLQVHKGSLRNWGLYIKALSDRGYPVSSLVTNVTFDATQNGVLNFAFNRFLTAEQYAEAKARATGPDVKVITAQSRNVVALPAPASTVALPGANFVQTMPLAEQPSTVLTVSAPPATGFGAVQAAVTVTPATVNGVGTTGATAAPVAAEAPKRTRRTREQIAADEAAKNGAAVASMPAAATGAAVPDPSLAHLPPAILAAVLAVGKDSVAGQAMMAQFPAIAEVADPFAGQPAHVKPAVEAAGGLGSVGGDAVFAALKVAAPQAGVPAPVVQPVVAAPVQAAPVAATGFGGTVAPVAAAPAPTGQVTDAAAALKLKLETLLKPKAA